MATFIMNEKRDFILNIEKRHNVRLLIIANPYLHSPQYTITKVKEDGSGKAKKPSYTLIQQPELDIIHSTTEVKKDEPAVKGFDPKPMKQTQSLNFLQRVMQKLFGSEDHTSKPDPTPTRSAEHSGHPISHTHKTAHGPSDRRRRPTNSSQRRATTSPNRKKTPGPTQPKPDVNKKDLAE
jgi:ribonuclease E